MNALQLKPRLAFALSTLAAIGSISSLSHAATYYYVDWKSADVAGGTASGVIDLPDGSAVTVGFAAINPDNSPGNLAGAQLDTGTDYWAPNTPYISAEVENPPLGPDILRLIGGVNQRYVVTLSEPIKDPIMAIVSLGQGSLTTTYEFDSPFKIVSQAAGYWGGSATALVAQAGNILAGSEGHGTIQFQGVFPTFSWTVPTPENWHGFTFGIRTTERLEPTPDAGAEPSPSSDLDAGAPPVLDASASATHSADAALTQTTATASASGTACVSPSNNAGFDGGAGFDSGAVLTPALSASAVASATANAPAGDAGAAPETDSEPFSGKHKVSCSCETVAQRSPRAGWALVACAGLALLRVRRRQS